MTAKLKQRIADGETVIVVNAGGANPDAVEMLAKHGADIVFIDCEHTGIGLDAATHCLRAARASGITTVVRTWSRDPAVIVQYFDRKADGIVLPHVESAEEAQALVEVTRYACGAGATEKILIVQIESKKGVEAVDAIGGVAGIDVVLVGPSDLTWDMTRQRDTSVPEVQSAIDHVCARLSAAGKRFGMPVPVAGIARFHARGGTFLYQSLDSLIQSSLHDLRSRVRAEK